MCGRPAICTLIGWFKSSHLFISLSGLCEVPIFTPLVDIGKLMETDKEMNRRELLNQPMRVQFAGLPCTVIISLSE